MPVMEAGVTVWPAPAATALVAVVADPTLVPLMVTGATVWLAPADTALAMVVMGTAGVTVWLAPAFTALAEVASVRVVDVLRSVARNSKSRYSRRPWSNQGV